ncbi:hypothetical protein LNKW23_20450 [Paralimibaculum aggregatum]|uniref:Zinc finger/thioredoxin putative domain-containing protein n=1 Tax=Paralimibaculum aggregatum TaxID=3036245 RepID=A0ABQ6LHR5_9RHOB|nr:zinc-ribbon domain-containing protein [Limibaculum sp. NKW23]GMG82832.1 hypothetical protein LNKW23_20450 [Limibaculum sp. NKW23]
MVEIECPNCNARYQVPAQALGPNGRDVTCSSCGNIWHAVPVSEAPPPIEASALGTQTRPPQQRTQQMSEIRQMLNEVQGNETRRGVPQAPEEGARQDTSGWGVTADPIGGGQPVREDVREAVFGHARREDGADEDEEMLRSRLGVGGQSSRLRSVRAKETQGETRGARKRLMNKHRRRNRKFEAEKRRGTGAGLTGFMLVVLVAGTLTGLYALAGPIAAAHPETAPVLRNYVTVVDGMRAGLNETLAGLRGAIEERIGSGEE